MLAGDGGNGFVVENNEQFILLGVDSFGSKCFEYFEWHEVLTNVAFHVDFIVQRMKM